MISVHLRNSGFCVPHDTHNSQTPRINLNRHGSDWCSLVSLRGGLQPPIASESGFHPLVCSDDLCSFEGEKRACDQFDWPRVPPPTENGRRNSEQSVRAVHHFDTAPLKASRTAFKMRFDYAKSIAQLRCPFCLNENALYIFCRCV